MEKVIDVFSRCEWTPYTFDGGRLRSDGRIGDVDVADLVFGDRSIYRQGTIELSLRSHLTMGIGIIPIDRDGRHEAGEDVNALLMMAT